MNKKHHTIQRSVLVTIIAVVVLLAGGGGFAYAKVYKERKALRADKANLEATLSTTQATLKQTEENNVSLNKGLMDAQEVNASLAQKLANEESKNAAFEAQIKQIFGTVGTLKKLSETDKELLMKYSKVYFLSENYVPSKLAIVPNKYMANKDGTDEFHGDALPFLTRMLDAASTAGMPLEVVSAYRSFDEQMAVKSGYKVLYGSGANQFSADQGYSEHQLGSTVDLTTPQIKVLSVALDTKPEYQWLRSNAHKYGFILSYPKGNAFYQYEPWHWRFVGVQLATRLHSENKYFYDLAQRDIDAYLISIFD